VAYIIIGVLGFLVAPLFEVASIKRIPGAKQCVGVFAAGLVTYAMVITCLKSDRLGLPLWLTSLGWILLLMSLLLVAYSLFINLPLRQTYISSGVEDRLVKTGTYALVRHPAVLWYALLLLSLILVSKAKLLLVASPIWLLMDTLYVFVQERLLFTKMFAGYDDYRRETPMLIPNRKSIGACIRTLRPPKAYAQVQGRRT
jgi:protein-S-isoprenylcysteine O-methyltransferase Ste14